MILRLVRRKARKKWIDKSGKYGYLKRRTYNEKNY